MGVIRIVSFLFPLISVLSSYSLQGVKKKKKFHPQRRTNVVILLAPKARQQGVFPSRRYTTMHISSAPSRTTRQKQSGK